MSNYRRSRVPGGTWFFTVTLADRESRLLIEQVALLRYAYGLTHHARPFQTLAICILPDHLHAIWTLPKDDADFAGRWSLLKSAFSRQLPAILATRARSASERKASGSGAIGNIRFGTKRIYSGTLITSTTTRSSMGW